jgi:hypothetical protein
VLVHRNVFNVLLVNMLLVKEVLLVLIVLLVHTPVMLVSVNANLVVWDTMLMQQVPRDVQHVLRVLSLLKMVLVHVPSVLLVNMRV